MGFFDWLFGDSEPAEERLIYRTQDGRHDYSFNFVRQQNRKYRLYITKQPGYNGRPTDSHSTHRYFDRAQGLHYVCILDGEQPDNMAHARNWAKQWAEATEKYRKFGTTF